MALVYFRIILIRKLIVKQVNHSIIIRGLCKMRSNAAVECLVLSDGGCPIQMWHWLLHQSWSGAIPIMLHTSPLVTQCKESHMFWTFHCRFWTWFWFMQVETIQIIFRWIKCRWNMELLIKFWMDWYPQV